MKFLKKLLLLIVMMVFIFLNTSFTIKENKNQIKKPLIKKEYFKKIVGHRVIIEKVFENCEEQEFDNPALIIALIRWETGGTYNVKSISYNRKKGKVISIDRGLMALNNKSFPELKIKDFYNIEINIHKGIEYLKEMQIKTGTETKALACYNGGHFGTRGGKNPPNSVLRYITEVQKYESFLEISYFNYLHNFYK